MIADIRIDPRFPDFAEYCHTLRHRLVDKDGNVSAANEPAIFQALFDQFLCFFLGQSLNVNVIDQGQVNVARVAYPDLAGEFRHVVDAYLNQIAWAKLNNDSFVVLCIFDGLFILTRAVLPGAAYGGVGLRRDGRLDRRKSGRRIVVLLRRDFARLLCGDNTSWKTEQGQKENAYATNESGTRPHQRSLTWWMKFEQQFRTA